MRSSWNEQFASLKDDSVLGDGWTWSRTKDGRVSSDNWRMTVMGDTIEVRPASDLRGGLLPVRVVIGRYAMTRMIVLTHCDRTEQALEKVFTVNQ